MATEVKSPGIDTSSRSGQQKAGDHTGKTDGADSGPNAWRDLTDKGSDVADDVAHMARQSGDTLKDKADDFGRSLQETGHTIAEQTRDGHEAVCDFTREYPTAAVLMAFGLGVIVAHFLPGR